MRTYVTAHVGSRCDIRTRLGIGLALLTVLAMLVVGFSQPVSASTGGLIVADLADCQNFETQSEAQLALDQNPEFASTLDINGNGIACDEITGGPVVIDPASCGHFDSQSDAQVALDENPDNAALVLALDPDGNGIACEDRFGVEPGDTVVVVCNEANGSLIEIRDESLLSGLDFPFHRATQAEITASACADTRPAVTPTAMPPTGTAPTLGTSPSEGTGATVTLPNTGAGSTDQGNGSLWLLPAAALIFVVVGLLSLPRRSR